MAKANSPEERKFPRFAKGLPSIKINDLSADWQGFFATVLNVSEGGFCVKISAELAMGKSFNFEMLLPGGEKVSGTAQCRWTRAAEDSMSRLCGSEILGFMPPDEGRWKRYIESLSRTA
jgi:hypothetical protein